MMVTLALKTVVMRILVVPISQLTAMTATIVQKILVTDILDARTSKDLMNGVQITVLALLIHVIQKRENVLMNTYHVMMIICVPMNIAMLFLVVSLLPYVVTIVQFVPLIVAIQKPDVLM
jgi:hypothetical protein